MAVVTNLLDAHAVSDPYAVFAELRDAGPVMWSPEHRAWILTSYAEVHHGFRDLRLSSDRLTPLERRLSPEHRRALGPTFDLLRGWMVFHDAPAHDRLREPVRRTFTPKAVEALRPKIAALVDELVSALETRLRDGETVDLVDAVAFPLPAIVIAELLGVPASDREQFKSWSSELGAIVFGASNRNDQVERATAGTEHFAEYFGALIERYRREPADNLVSALVAVADGGTADAGSGLTPGELVGALTLLLFGGHETTANLIGNATFALLQQPDALAWMHDHPEAIVGSAEELHRYDGPTKVMVRVVDEPHDRHGFAFEPGQTVFLSVAGANRDPAVFDEPDRLMPDRPNGQAHLGFGYGVHYCVGAPLARLEAQVAMGALVARLPDLQLGVPVDDLVWGSSILGRGLRHLPVAMV